MIEYILRTICLIVGIIAICIGIYEIFILSNHILQGTLLILTGNLNIAVYIINKIK